MFGLPKNDTLEGSTVLSPIERRILLITCYGHFMCHFNVLVFPALVLPLVAGLGLPMAQVLGLSFWQYLLFGLSALPWGIAGDRWGGKSLMAIMFLGAGLSGLAAAIWIDSPLGLTVALAGLGLFSGIYHPIGLGLISKGISRLTMAMGYNAMFGGLGLVAAPLAAGLLNWIWGPYAPYVFVAAANLLGLGIMALLPLKQPEPRTSTRAEAGNGMLMPFMVLLMAMMLGGIAYRGATVILPAYLELKNIALLETLSGIWGSELSGNLLATTITASIYLVGVVGQYTGGVVGERHDTRYSYLVFHAICIPAALFMAYASNLALIGLAAVYFFFLLGMQPIENTLVARITPRKLHHSAFGMKFILTFGVGALAVKMVEYIDVTWGVEATFLALGLTSVLLVGFIVLLIRITDASSVAATSETG
jgi:MFS transporter, FSR family, fosmidomycin resistance protein